MRGIRYLWWCLICSWSILRVAVVQGQINVCGDPINSLLSEISQTNIHSTVSLISDRGSSILNDPLTDYNYFSKAVKILNADTFPQDLLYIANDTVQTQYLIILPNSTESAANVLNWIGVIEKNNSFIRKIQSYIVWPTDCPTNVDCLQVQVEQLSIENLPSVSSDCFIMHCGLSNSGLSTAGSWNLYNVYSIGREKLLKLNPISFSLENNNAYQKKMNFSSATIQAAIPTQDKLLPEELSYETENETTKLTGGLDYNVIGYLQDSLHFKLNFSFSEELFYKNEKEWRGLARKLLDDEADICLSKVNFLPFRRECFTFLVPHFVEGIQAFFRQPPASSIRNIFFQPFTKNLWLTLIVVWLLVGFSNVLAAKIKSIYEQLLTQDEQISKDSILLSIAFTCQQGWHLDPQSISMKIIFFCGSVMGLIIYVAYSAALVSTLSTTIVPIKKFGNVLENDFSITYEPGSSTLQYLLNGSYSQGSADDEFDSHQLNLLRSKVIKTFSTHEGVRLVLQSHAAFLGFSDVFYTIAKGKWKQKDRDLCEHISSVRFSKVPFRSGLIVQWNSPLKEFFDYKLIILYEYGIMRRIQRNYVLSFRGECDKQSQKKGQGLGIKDLFTAYVIIVAGHILSFVIFLMERLHFRRAKAQFEIKNPNFHWKADTSGIFGPVQPDNYIF